MPVDVRICNCASWIASATIKKAAPGKGSLSYFGADILRLYYRLNGDERLSFFLLFENHYAVGESKQGMIPANAYVLAWVMLGSALAYDDVAGNYLLTAEHLDTESFAF